MKNYKIMLIAIIVISLIAGTAFGFWGGQTYIRYRFHKGRSNGEYLKSKILNRLDNILRLDDEQRASITAILEDIADEHKEILKDFKDKMKAVRDKKGEEIKTVLTEEQKKRFDEWKEKRKKKRLRGKTHHPERGRFR